MHASIALSACSSDVSCARRVPIRRLTRPTDLIRDPVNAAQSVVAQRSTWQLRREHWHGLVHFRKSSDENAFGGDRSSAQASGRLLVRPMLAVDCREGDLGGGDRLSRSSRVNNATSTSIVWSATESWGRDLGALSLRGIRSGMVLLGSRSRLRAQRTHIRVLPLADRLGGGPLALHGRPGKQRKLRHRECRWLCNFNETKGSHGGNWVAITGRGATVRIPLAVARCSASSTSLTEAVQENEDGADRSRLGRRGERENEKGEGNEGGEGEDAAEYDDTSSGQGTKSLEVRPYPLFFSRRLQVMLLVAVALILCSADRVIMSIAIVPLAATNGWGETVAGVVQSSFLWGYMMTPIVGGSMADRYGGKGVLAAGIGIWSMATVLTPLAARSSLAALCCVRVIMGLGEGVALPCMNNLLARWMPGAERATAVGIAMAGFTMGNMVGLLSAPLLMSVLGNTGPFLAFGLIGLLWVPLWLKLISTDPRQHPKIDAAELAYITGGSLQAKARGVKGGGLQSVERELRPKHVEKASTRLLPMSVLLSKPAVWANIVGNAVNNWGFFILLSWMPIYFKKIFGVNLRDAAWFSSGPWAVMAIMGYVAGLLADWMVHSLRIDISTVRKLMQCLGFLGPAIGLTLLRSASRPETASLFLTLSLGLSACSQAGFIVNFQDLGPKHAGVLHGMANTVGTAAGILGTIIAGWLAETTGSFQTVLIVTSIVYAAGAAFWTSLGTAQQLFD